jgi:uncharacterized protein (DUF433 family)
MDGRLVQGARAAPGPGVYFAVWDNAYVTEGDRAMSLEQTNGREGALSARDDDLIAREIEEDAYSPGPADVRLRRSGVHVWAIVGHYLYAVNGDTAAVARDYTLSPDEVEAALAYYRRHPQVIEGRLAANRRTIAR